ncbi:MAG: DUF4199 domain-containing protein [Hyphomonadaceae bacterium]|nr:DUF4199 domain-containing protein [Hyphomonadaceae bacterium]
MNRILTYGLMAGLIVAIPMFSALVIEPSPEFTASSQVLGFTIMIVAFSLIFVSVKRLRDRELGGVIRFMPAFALGLGISAVASVIYVVGWEITLHLTDFGFMETYAQGVLQKARDAGATAAELDKKAAELAAFRSQYANPLFRLPVTFIEIFPIGVIVSLISAAVLRNPRVLPARPAVA